MVANKKSTEFPQLTVLFHHNFSLTNRTEFANVSNYSQLDGETTVTNSFMVGVLVSIGKRKKQFGIKLHVSLQMIPSNHQEYQGFVLHVRFEAVKFGHV